MPPTLVLEPRRSRYWLGICCTLLACTGLLLAISAVRPAVGVLVFTGTLAALVIAGRSGGWLGGRPPPRIAWGPAGGWRLCRPGSTHWQEVVLRHDYLVSSVLIVLRFEGSGGRPCSVLLLPDSLSAANLRRLRMLLLWRPEMAGARSVGLG